MDDCATPGGCGTLSATYAFKTHIYLRAQSHIEETKGNRGIGEQNSTNEIFALSPCDYFIG